MIKKIVNQVNIYTLIWCLYNLQGLLYAEGGSLSKGLGAIFLVVSSYYFIKVVSVRNLPRPLSYFSILVVLFGVYGVIRVNASPDGWVGGMSAPTTFLKVYEMSILPIFAFYYFAKKHLIGVRWFTWITIVYTIVALLQYYYHQVVLLEKFNLEEVTNNSGYFVLSLFPLVVFHKKRPLIQYGWAFLIFSLVVLSYKRGAMLIGAIALVYWTVSLSSHSKRRNRWVFVIGGIVVIVLAVQFFLRQMDTSMYLQQRIEQTSEGDMSRREIMYPLYYNYFFSNANGVQLIFGYGADGLRKYLGSYAHQDWLQVLFDLGVVGFTFLLLCWISLIKFVVSTRRLQIASLTNMVALFVIIYFMKSLFSMSINSMPLFATSVLGYALAVYKDEFLQEELVQLENR